MQSISSAPLLFDESDTYGLFSDLDNPTTLGGTESRSLSLPSDLELLNSEATLVPDWPDTDVFEDPIPSQDFEHSQEPPILTEPVSTSTNVEVQLPVSTLTQPRSLYFNFEPPAPETTEPRALDALAQELKLQDPIEGEDFIEFVLDDFSIYIDSVQYPNELRPLQHLNKAERFYFDGTLCTGKARFYLRRVPFRELPIGNYGADYHSVGDQIWIRSFLNEKLKKEIYYKLGSPSVEYTRFHAPFLWVANLAKHVLDYCAYLQSSGRRAVLHDFKSRFSIWLLRKHRKSKAFQTWYDAHGSDDFRGAIVANVLYIWREACGVDRKGASYHRLWKEINSLTQYRPNIGFSNESLGEIDEEAAPRPRKKDVQQHYIPPKTTVTPYIHDLFSHMSFGQILEKVTPSPDIQKRRTAVILNDESRSLSAASQTSHKRPNSDWERFIASIQRGDVISTPPDDAERTKTTWKLETSVHHENKHVWYGLVQDIHQTPRGKHSFDVIWLYHPRDTPCAKMKYPWKNELFLSDNCTCHSNMATVKDADIISTHQVHWFGSPSTSAEFFVRQTYTIDEQRWVTLQAAHMKCADRDMSIKQDKFEVGDAVLVHTKSKSLELENFVVESFFDEGAKRFVRLRKLLRRRLVDPKASGSPPNELLYSARLVEIEARSIARRCLVRVFRLDEKIPAPYDRNGIGDAFFITHQELVTEDGQVQYVPANIESLGSLRQGFNPSRTVHSQKLKGLDLFCGGGNFGRGLEDSNAIEMRWTNDIWKEAIHTYMANVKPDSCTPFLGSVDDLLRHALLGDGKAPRPGEVQFISGGSPCPGFSLLTNDKTTDKQRKNQSLVASFASYIDLYRPHYGLLENVIQMVQAKHNRDECVFSQLVSAVVGLGYQTQILFMDAWSFGAPQSRSRVFLLFTAPGLRVPKIPVPTHSHPPGMGLRRLGLMSNGQSFSQRERLPTPFKFTSAMEAVSDLPDIQDSKADYCVGFPDHRLSMGYTPMLRKQVQHIPTQPWEMNFSKAYYGAGVMDESTRWQLYPAKEKSRTQVISRGWGRIHPHDLFPTITTSCGPSDARIGQINHWHQPRPITILEARRAQGFLDTEVILGSPRDQYRIVGNSVARQVALSLGLAIREAWFGTLLDEKPIPQRQTAAAVESVDKVNTSFDIGTPDITTTSIDTGLTPLATAAADFPVAMDSASSTDELTKSYTDELWSRNTPLTTPGTSDINSELAAADCTPKAATSAPTTVRRKRSSTLYVEVVNKKQRHQTDATARDSVSSAPDIGDAFLGLGS
ncbi:hypothetical protein SLS62_003665 [Diatrype stigma]|uniref:DNA (cytosine-5-)-methyltransferase n=1 Tax=Diatrype stigma TaxID=117547 RepID=A0AAN9UW86_9PEZI